METYEKASSTELKIITPQPPQETVVSLKKLKTQLAALRQKEVDYPLAIQKQLDTEMAGVQQEIESLEVLVAEAEKLEIKEDTVLPVDGIKVL